MVNGSGVNPLVRYLHTVFNAQALAGLSDGQLLDRFLARRDALLTVPIKSGEYKYGQATKVVTFKRVTYSLLVTAPR